MESLMDKLLSAKHWQLFLVVVAFPFLCNQLLGAWTSNRFEVGGDTAFIVQAVLVVSIAYLVSGIVLSSWIWSVAMGLQKFLPENVKLKVDRFRLFFVIPIIYVVCILVFLGIIASKLVAGNFDPDGTSILIGVLIILPFHMFAVFGAFYAIYFAAKTFKSIELGREARFGDLIGEFLMICVFAVGVWINSAESQ